MTGVTEVEAPEAELDAADVVGDAEDTVGAMSWFASSTQSLEELQVYPNGQHAFPQAGSVAVSAVVMSKMPGLAVTFCSEISHPTALMVEQELPAGQQSTVVLPASTTQSEEGSQQKFDGSPA